MLAGLHPSLARRFDPLLKLRKKERRCENRRTYIEKLERRRFDPNVCPKATFLVGLIQLCLTLKPDLDGFAILRAKLFTTLFAAEKRQLFEVIFGLFFKPFFG